MKIKLMEGVGRIKDKKRIRFVRVNLMRMKAVKGFLVGS